MTRMSKHVVVIVLVCAAWRAVARAGPAVERESLVTGMAAGSRRLAALLFRQVSDEKRNFVLSPFCIQAAMAMVYAGSDGATAEEIRGAMGFHSGPDGIGKEWTTVQRRLGARHPDSRFAIELSQAIWIDEGFPVASGYQEAVTGSFRAEIVRTRFSDPSRTSATINEWASRVTRGRIHRALSPAAVQRLGSGFVVSAATYFKGPWSHQFDRKLTKLGAFRRLDGTVTRCPFMTTTFWYCFAEVDDLQVLQLPIDRGEFSAVVVLPRGPAEFLRIRRSLRPKHVATWLNSLKVARPRPIQVHLPSFAIDTSCEMASALEAIGMPTAFAPGEADLRKISASKRKATHMVFVRHCASLRVNEEGVEGASVVLAGGLSGTPERADLPTFSADSPFLFMLVHRATGVIVFFGQCLAPANPDDGRGDGPR